MLKLYKCAHCGNIVEMVEDRGVNPVCCGELMQELVPNTTDAAQEKHVPVIEVEGNKVIVTHGNGPQVGMINLAFDNSYQNDAGTPLMPFAECGAMSQGYIGYQLQQCIQDELERQKIKKDCATLITQVLVDPKDTAFKNPTKPIGSFYTKEDGQNFCINNIEFGKIKVKS